MAPVIRTSGSKTGPVSQGEGDASAPGGEHCSVVLFSFAPDEGLAVNSWATSGVLESVIAHAGSDREHLGPAALPRTCLLQPERQSPGTRWELPPAVQPSLLFSPSGSVGHPGRAQGGSLQRSQCGPGPESSGLQDGVRVGWCAQRSREGCGDGGKHASGRTLQGCGSCFSGSALTRGPWDRGGPRKPRQGNKTLWPRQPIES